jgi:hypothetical protein
VRRRNPDVGGGHGNKRDERFLGPYRVVGRTTNGNYNLTDEAGRGPFGPFAASHLKATFEPTNAPEKVFTVEKIVSHRDTGQGREYLVHWTGYSASERTWTPREHFIDTRAMSRYEAMLARRDRQGAARGNHPSAQDQTARGRQGKTTRPPPARTHRTSKR